MQVFIAFLVGVILGAIGGALVFRNNAKKAEAALAASLVEYERLKGRVK